MATPTLVNVSHVFQNNPSAQGISAVLPAAASANDALIAIVFGTKKAGPFGITSLGNATPAPVINDNENSTWASVVNLVNIDLISGTPSLSPPAPPSSYESNTDLYANFPSVYVFSALAVAAGAQNVNVRSVYLDQNAAPWSSAQTYSVGDAVTSGGNIYVSKKGGNLNNIVSNTTFWGQVTPTQAQTDARFAGGPGRAVYNGLDVVLLDLSGIATSAAVDGTAVAAVSAANPANAGSITTTTNGDLIIAIGLQKDSNSFSAPAGWTVAATGKLVGSEEHYIVMYKIQASSGAITPGFTNPNIATAATTQQAYETAVLAFALKHS